ncbi:MAG TPA: ATP-binding protein [Candidatus Borkfalkia excrementavium]|uniref:ATP-binding protein n=1 Tax=Candidatus Borkfalkia excrementavium TaxID=2838505 RepID=A0A9D1Z7M3_9FIRM|nr:ATP-binding protein [Candidatus Borkfalkia excrementavium]
MKTDGLILLKNIFSDSAAAAFRDAVEKNDVSRYAEAYGLLLERDAVSSFAAYLQNVILLDPNLFARRAVSGSLTEEIEDAYRRDLVILQDFARQTEHYPEKISGAEQENLPKISYGKDNPLFGKDWSGKQTLQRLKTFYKENGYGIFISHKAFIWTDHGLKQVENTPDISLSDLKNYETEKRAVEDNVENFVRSLPYSDMLLYGDKGTGKSSTIHAVLNKYAEQGLRAVEITKDQIPEINKIKETLAKLPFKFMIFIDDLSLEEHDEKVGSLKASLEGSMNGKSANVMIAATSNRRHILKENFSDRENSVHASDTMEEQLSLSDRFGITVLFASTNKRDYLSIVEQLAKDRNLRTEAEKLDLLAERWALAKGGRSPRRAKQFIDFAYACEKKNMEIEF